jgi:protein tyrosine/serine phosphatase
MGYHPSRQGNDVLGLNPPAPASNAQNRNAAEIKGVQDLRTQSPRSLNGFWLADADLL